MVQLFHVISPSTITFFFLNWRLAPIQIAKAWQAIYLKCALLRFNLNHSFRSPLFDSLWDFQFVCSLSKPPSKSIEGVYCSSFFALCFLLLSHYSFTSVESHFLFPFSRRFFLRAKEL